MFRCSDTTFVTFENRKFLFSRLTLFLLYLYSVFKVHPDFFKPVSGDNEIRTRDPLLARQVLSQLSYTPRVGLNGLEPSTSRLSGVRSNQLSYKPMLDTSHFCVMSIKQLNPATTDFPGQFPTKYFQAV